MFAEPPVQCVTFGTRGGMRTRIWIGLATACAGVFAAYKGDLAAVYIAIAWGSLTYVLHGVEFKLDRLLDHHGIFVSPNEIAKD
jgi:hypothetical protein